MSKCEYCEPYEKTCGVKCPRPTCSTNWPCTRAAGHEGDHVACGPTQCEIERWPNETPDADTDVPVVLTAPGYYAESLLTMREMADGIKVIRKAIECVRPEDITPNPDRRISCSECGTSIPPFGQVILLDNVIFCPRCAESKGRGGYRTEEYNTTMEDAAPGGARALAGIPDQPEPPINETEEDTSPVDDAYLIADLQQRLLKSQREAVEQHNVDGQLIASLKKQVAQAIELQGELAQATMRIEYLEMVRAVNTENGSMP